MATSSNCDASKRSALTFGASAAARMVRGRVVSWRSKDETSRFPMCVPDGRRLARVASTARATERTAVNSSRALPASSSTKTDAQ
eukprot:scaffold106020_cov28-Tisochrysis_lutea.AAC.3